MKRKRKTKRANENVAILFEDERKKIEDVREFNKQTDKAEVIDYLLALREEQLVSLPGDSGRYIVKEIIVDQFRTNIVVINAPVQRTIMPKDACNRPPVD